MCILYFSFNGVVYVWIKGRPSMHAIEDSPRDRVCVYFFLFFSFLPSLKVIGYTPNATHFLLKKNSSFVVSSLNLPSRCCLNLLLKGMFPILFGKSMSNHLAFPSPYGESMDSHLTFLNPWWQPWYSFLKQMQFQIFFSRMVVYTYGKVKWVAHFHNLPLSIMVTLVFLLKTNSISNFFFPRMIMYTYGRVK